MNPITAVNGIWITWHAQIAAHTGRDVVLVMRHPIAGAWFSASKDSKQFAAAWRAAAFDLERLPAPS